MPSPTQSALPPLVGLRRNVADLVGLRIRTAEIDTDVAQTEAAALARFGKPDENEHSTDDDQNGIYGHCALSSVSGTPNRAVAWRGPGASRSKCSTPLGAIFDEDARLDQLY